MSNIGKSQANTLLFNEVKKTIGSKMAYAAIEGNILTAAKGEQKKTFLLTSSVSGEGKTFTTLVMTQSLASSSNAKVLLIEGNVHKPQLAQAFELNRKGMGMYEYFSAECEPKDAIVETGHQNIFLMPLSDNNKPNIDRCFHRDLFEKQLNKLKESDFDYILLDGSAVIGFSDTLAVAKFFDSVILVIECEKTKWEVVQLASEKLSMVKGKKLGAILNKRSYPVPKRFYG